MKAPSLALAAGLLASAASLPAATPVPAPRLEAVLAPDAPPAAAPAAAPGDERSAFRQIFAAIRAQDWATAASLIDAYPTALLAPVARAELILAKGSPRAEAPAILDVLARAPDLPQAPALAKLARSRGAADLPALPPQRDLIRYAGAPKRAAARPTRSDAAATVLSAAVTPLLRADRPAEAEALVEAAAATLTAEALTEWRQKVAWGWYQVGDDAAALRTATLARGGTGEWAAQADWVAGLAAWRARDCANAADAFASAGTRARDSETVAAGLFWAARADMACGRPERVQPRLRTAARLEETFYGLLAGETLALAHAAEPPAAIDTRRVELLPNVRMAAALAELGEAGLADALLRQQARIGLSGDHRALHAVAQRIGLPGTQMWLAQNGPAGAGLSASAHYPVPGWAPASGWRVDKALLFAHALQESQFRADAVSPAGARGLMQLMPGTAELIARKRGEPAADLSRLSDPAFSLEYGQYYLQDLAEKDGTGGLLPKVIAAYNAGPGRLPDWNVRSRAGDDPLLFIESIPYAETRAYVTIVLRNYWMYQRTAGVQAASCRAMAQGQWPRFPGLAGRTALRTDVAGGGN
ncbi:MAG: lytic transglycosylase domain-containing protein [Sphingomonas fennica]